MWDYVQFMYATVTNLFTKKCLLFKKCANSNNSKIQRQEPQTPWNNLNSPTKIPTPLRYSGSQIKERTYHYTAMPQKKETKIRLFEGDLDLHCLSIYEHDVRLIRDK